MESKQGLPSETKELTKKIDDFLKSKLSLGSDEAKATLKEMVSRGWSAIKMAKRLNVATGTISVVLGRHGISKPRLPVESGYSKTQDEIIKEYYDKPKNSRSDSTSLRDQMVAAVNEQRAKEKLEPATIGAIRAHLKMFNVNWNWGWPKEGQSVKSQKAGEAAEKAAEAEALNKAYASVRPYLKEHGRIRNKEAAKLMGLDKRASRDMLEKLTLTKNAKLLGVRGEGKDQTTWYFSAEEGFYTTKELLSIFPREECARIARDGLQTIKGGGTHSVSKLASQFYPGQTGDNIVRILLPELLEESLDVDIITIDSSGNYKKGVFCDFGDPESIRVVHRIGQITMDRLEEKRRDFETPADIIAARKASMKKILTRPFEIGSLLPTKGPINILFAAGLQEGHMLAAEEFLDKALKNLENHPELGPHIALANRFVQGNFSFSDIMCGLTLDDFAGFDEIDPQIKAAGVWFNAIQRLPQNRALFINTSVDEKRTAKDYALKDMLHGQQWHKVFGLNLSPERQRFVKNKFFFHLLRFQAEVVVTYWLQIGRAPYNDAQMDALAKQLRLSPLGQNEKVAMVNLYWAETFGSKERYPRLSDKDKELVDKIRSKYKGWAHWTSQPDPHAKNFKELWEQYSRPVNLYALMGEEAKKFVRQ